MNSNLRSETCGNAEILVFRTNLRDKKDVARIAPVLRSEGRIHLWTVDLADIDKVLRIEAEELTTGQVSLILRQQGFECEEL
jgi:hypothetical protein